MVSLYLRKLSYKFLLQKQHLLFSSLPKLNANGGKIFLSKISPPIECSDVFLMKKKPSLLKTKKTEKMNKAILKISKNMWV